MSTHPKRQVPALVAAVLGTLLTVSACTSHSSSSESGSAGSNVGVAPAAAGDAPASVLHGSSASGAFARSAPSNTSDTGDAATTAALQPALIVTAGISVRVPNADDLAGAAARADALAVDAGGRVDADDRAGGRSPTAHLTLRVPNAAVTTTLNQLGALGHETARNRSTRDVTTELADVDSRVISARSAIRTLDALYARATRVRDVIAVETTLSQREADLESLESQQRALQGQTGLATITADLSVAPHRAVPAAKASTPGGFVGGVEHGWRAFVTTVSALATALGAVLPFAFVLLVIGAGYLVHRRRKGRTAPPVTDGA